MAEGPMPGAASTHAEVCPDARTGAKSETKNSVLRVVLVGVAVFVQIAWLFVMLLRVASWSPYVQAGFSVAATLIALNVLCREQNSAYKLLWVCVLLALPIFGILLYVLLELSPLLGAARKRFRATEGVFRDTLPANADVLAELAAQDATLGNCARYLSNEAGAALWCARDVGFFSEASDAYEAQIADIARARSFIFLEYHAIEDSTAFARMKGLLAQKAAEGVDVRIVYDDLGNFGFVTQEFVRRMEAIGVKCRAFNPLIPLLNVFMNNRDHRKICVVDGVAGYTGGYNLADEYFNITHPYGVWKDTGVRLTGPAVSALTKTFLEMWVAMGDTDEGDYARFFPEATEEGPVAGLPDDPAEALPGVAQRSPEGPAEGAKPPTGCDYGVPVRSEEAGWVQPYADSPLDSKPVGENVYLNTISAARRRLWVTTPYLVIDDEMTRALTLAAARGVDVRVVTPGIPDKKLVYTITRSYYPQLARAGVRIYEWTPGFLHAKQMLADDDLACVGTINLDYRSLYLHFENGCALYRCPCIADIAADFERLFEQATEVTESCSVACAAPRRLWQRILRLLSPLV